MAGFLYFVEGTSTVNETHAALKAAGAAYVLEGKPQTTSGPTVGPEDKRGGAVAPSVGPGGTQVDIHHPDKLRWTEVPGPEGKPGYWIGYDPTSKPTPADLALPTGFTGHPVELGDGNTWLVPVARRLTGQAAFPQRLERIDGKWKTGDVVPAYADRWKKACLLWDHMTTSTDDRPSLTIDDATEIIVEALALNYRLGPEEVNVLGLLDTLTLVAAGEAIIDLPAVDELQKKLEAATSSSTPGDEG